MRKATSLAALYFASLLTSSERASAAGSRGAIRHARRKKRVAIMDFDYATVHSGMSRPFSDRTWT